MRFGYWLPVFGGWLRNVDDGGMQPRWEYARRLARRSEELGSLEDYSVSNRGLRAGLAGTPEQVADRIREFEAAGVDLLLVQFSPQHEEMERFAEQVMPLVAGSRYLSGGSDIVQTFARSSARSKMTREPLGDQAG